MGWRIRPRKRPLVCDIANTATATTINKLFRCTIKDGGVQTEIIGAPRYPIIIKTNPATNKTATMPLPGSPSDARKSGAKRLNQWAKIHSAKPIISSVMCYSAFRSAMAAAFAKVFFAVSTCRFSTILPSTTATPCPDFSISSKASIWRWARSSSA